MEDLNIIKESCEALTQASCPEKVRQILPQLLEDIRKISESGYYKQPNNLSGLLRRVANAVVNSSATYLSLHEIFNGDALLSISQLLDCRKLIADFNKLYRDICNSGVWEEDSSVVASCDAFS